MLRRSGLLALVLLFASAPVGAACDPGTLALSWTSHQLLPGPRTPLLADLDGDGVPDLAYVTRGDSSGVAIELGLADGTFGPPRVYPAGLLPSACATLDFDFDGRPDLAVANAGSSDITMLHNVGDASFTVASTTPTDASPVGLVVADVNADGQADVLTYFEALPQIDVHYGLSSLPRGELSPAFPILLFPGYGRVTSLAADELTTYTATACPDLVFGRENFPGVETMQGCWTGVTPRFGDETESHIGNSTARGIVTGNLAGLGNQFVAIFPDTKEVSMSPAQAYHATSRPRCVATLDFDRDGLADLLVGTDDGVLVLAARSVQDVPAGTLHPVANLPAPHGLDVLLFADFDHDGFAELAACDTSAATFDVAHVSCSPIAVVPPPPPVIGPWPETGFPLCVVTGDRSLPVLEPDGSGGAFAAWEDTRGGDRDVYVSHVRGDATLAAGWPADGLPALTGAGDQVSPDLVADGIGGVYVFALEGDSASLHTVWRRVHADGSVAPEQLLNPGRIELQVDAVPDGEGGFLAATLDVTDPAEQRTRVVHGPTNNLAAYGWAPSGLVWNLGSADHPIRYLDAIPDGGYGIVLHAREDYAWHCGTSNQCLYADYDFVDHLVDGIDLQHRGVPSYGRVDSMRVDPFGGWIELNLNWQVDPSTPFATRYGPTDTSWASTLAFPGSGFTGLCGDGVGGAYFAWNVAGVTRLRRVAANGSVAPVWDPGVEIPAPIAMEADGHGGVFTAWFEADGLRAAHRDSTSGFAAGWNPSAGPIGPNAIAAKGLRLAADLRGGALAAWVDGGRGAQDLYLMRLSGGATAIPFGIRMLSSGYHDGAVHFAWTIEGAIPFDYELERMDLATGEDLVVARTRHGDGTLELDDPTVQAGHSYAYVLTGRVNGVVAYRSEPIEIAIPQGETFELALGTRTPGRRGDALRFSLPDDAPATLALYDARGRRVLAVSAAGPGWHAVNPGRLMAGVYWLRLDSAGRRVTMKMVWLD